VAALCQCSLGSFHLLKKDLGVPDKEIGLGGEPDPAAGRLDEAPSPARRTFVTLHGPVDEPSRDLLTAATRVQVMKGWP
jgi:hypothetical protein